MLGKSSTLKRTVEDMNYVDFAHANRIPFVLARYDSLNTHDSQKRRLQATSLKSLRMNCNYANMFFTGRTCTFLSLCEHLGGLPGHAWEVVPQVVAWTLGNWQGAVATPTMRTGHPLLGIGLCE